LGRRKTGNKGKKREKNKRRKMEREGHAMHWNQINKQD